MAPWETMTRSELETFQLSRLRHGLSRLSESNPFYQKKFSQWKGVAATLSREEFALLPFTTKEELLDDQSMNPPYGTNLTRPVADYVRLHQTSGTSGRRLRWLDSPEGWAWFLECWNDIYDAIGIDPTDRFFVPFSFGPFLGFWAAFEGAVHRGCFTLAGGGMTSIARLQAILDHQITVVCTTPTYASHLLETAGSVGMDLSASAVRLLVLAGEPGAQIPALRLRLEHGWRARVIDHSGMTEVGSIGIEFADFPGKLFLLENQCLPEFIDPVTCKPVAAGELGELVVTNLGRWDSPLVRYRTGDLARWQLGPHPATKPFIHLDGGIIGRVDDMLYIKGNNVYPSSLEAVLREESQVAEFAIDIDETTTPAEVTIVVEPRDESASDGLVHRLGRLFQDRLLFRPEIELTSPGSLPRFEHKAQRLRRHRPS
ncbi:phenylacetate--CoA ligase family protein [bacterium]|nr:phenylacetate--CoA ligase family protein [bacterium]